jgi:ABC-type branched-subunit amino acid transport system ATPase component
VTLLRAEAITAGYGRLPVVHDVDVACAGGDITALIGPNGAGKSTLLKAIAGVVPLMGGCVSLDGNEVSSLPVDQRVRHGLVYVPQIEDVFPSLTVAENLEMRMYLQHRKRSQLAQDVADLTDLFPAVAAKWRRKAGTLSGGQRKMLALAGALAARPRALMLDEPSAGLAPSYIPQIWESIRRIAVKGIAVLVVEQNVTEALVSAQSVYVLVAGQVVLSGPPSTVSEQDLSGLFLGKRGVT